MAESCEGESRKDEGQDSWKLPAEHSLFELRWRAFQRPSMEYRQPLHNSIFVPTT
jgi:hypothetical protein